MGKDIIEIPLSKGKMTLTFIGAIVLIAIGFWLVSNPPTISNPIFGNSTLILIIGITSIFLFGLAAVIIFRKFSNKKPGLIISNAGIVDNSSGVSAGIIPWSDIQDIKTAQVMSQRFLMIIVKNPQDYLDKVQNVLKKNAMKLNYKSYGSPIAISSNSLKIGFDELEQLLIEKMTEFKK